MKRISKKQLDNSTFILDKNKKKPKFELLIYDKRGNECEYLPEDQIIAKKQNDGKSTKFYIRTNNDGKFYRPDDKSYIDSSYRAVIKNALPPFTLKSVSKEVFDTYLVFLVTKKNEYYIQAEKGI